MKFTTTPERIISYTLHTETGDYTFEAKTPTALRREANNLMFETRSKTGTLSKDGEKIGTMRKTPKHWRFG